VTGHARARLGAAYWLFTDDEPCLLGCEPPCPEGTPVNPTLAAPPPPGVPGPESSERAPSVCPRCGTRRSRRPRTPRRRPRRIWRPMRCPGWRAWPVPGSASGAAGSSSTATVDRVTGRFIGERPFVRGRHRAASRGPGLGFQHAVHQCPARRRVPVVSYRLALTTAHDGAASSGIDQQGFDHQRQQIPLTDLVRCGETTNSPGWGRQHLAARRAGHQGAGPAATSTTADRHRSGWSAPVVVIGAASDLARAHPGPGHGAGGWAARLFEGAFSAPDPPLRERGPHYSRIRHGPAGRTQPPTTGGRRAQWRDRCWVVAGAGSARPGCSPAGSPTLIKARDVRPSQDPGHHVHQQVPPAR